MAAASGHGTGSPNPSKMNGRRCGSDGQPVRKVLLDALSAERCARDPAGERGEQRMDQSGPAAVRAAQIPRLEARPVSTVPY